jgi:rhamnosyltransferase
MTDWSPRVSIIMRSCNDSDVIRATLEMVRAQTYANYELWNFDSTSTDGTLEIISEFNRPERIRLNDPDSYNPGRVLNAAVAATSADILVFLNSDATPQSVDWLAQLIAPLQDAKTGASYGRQTARPDCRSLFVKDTERAFGDGRIAAGWLHFFSMANSAVRRELLERYPFETSIQYSEDIDWSYRMRKLGHRIVYVPEAAAMHSHNYSLRQSYKRHFGEGMAEAWIFRSGELNTSFLRYCLLPLGREVLRDLEWAIRGASMDALVHSVPLRTAQKWGRWQGLKSGRACYAGS